MTRIKTYLLFLFIFALLLPFGVKGQESLILPIQQKETTIVAPNDMNDAFIRYTPVSGLLGSELEFQHNVVMDLYDPAKEEVTTNGFYGSPATWDLMTLASSVPDGTVIHVKNQTSDPLDAQLKTEFYKLPVGNNSIENVLLKHNQRHVFEMDLEQGVPVAIMIDVDGSSHSTDLKISIVDPDNKVHTQTWSLSVFLPDIRTMVPQRNGTHVFVLEPLTGDIVLKSMLVVKDIQTIKFNGGISETVQGTLPTLKIYQLNSSSGLKVLSADGFVFVPDQLMGYSRPTDLLGLIRLRIFSPMTGIFGSDLTVGYSSPILNTSSVYVSVEILPPDESDPFIRGEKERLNLPEGFFGQYAFWTEEEDIPPLPIDEETQIINPAGALDNIYSYSSSSPFLASLNGSHSSVEATFTDMSSGKSFVVKHYDALNGEGNENSFIPAGTYLVSVSSSLDFRSFRFKAVPIQSLSTGASATLNLPLFGATVLELPSPSFSNDFFNITYLDHLNVSVTLGFDLFNEKGERIFSKNATLHQYASRDDPVYSSTNGELNWTSVFAYQGIDYHNVRKSWLLIRYLNNTVWDSSISFPTPLQYANNSFNAQFRIDRFDYWNLKKQMDPLARYPGGSVGTGFVDPLNASFSEILYRLQFNLKEGGNYISIISENHTFSASLLKGLNSSFWTFTPQSETINGTTFYKADMIVPGLPSDVMALVILFNYTTSPQTVNGRLNITVLTLPFTQLLFAFNKLSAISLDDISTETSISLTVGTTITGNTTSVTVVGGEDLLTDPLVLGGAAVAVAAVGGTIIYFVRKRGRPKKYPL